MHRTGSIASVVRCTALRWLCDDGLVHVVTMLLGIAAIVYGLYVAYLRSKDPDNLGKLEPMKKLWGDRVGVFLHGVGYTVIPIAFGATLIWMAINEVPLLGG